MQEIINFRSLGSSLLLEIALGNYEGEYVPVTIARSSVYHYSPTGVTISFLPQCIKLVSGTKNAIYGAVESLREIAKSRRLNLERDLN